jgi:ribonuclease PH
VDMNLVMTDKGEFIEIQGTGEESPFNKTQLQELMGLGEKGVNDLIEAQKQSLGEIAGKVGMINGNDSSNK